MYFKEVMYKWTVWQIITVIFIFCYFWLGLNLELQKLVIPNWFVFCRQISQWERNSAWGQHLSGDSERQAEDSCFRPRGRNAAIAWRVGTEFEPQGDEKCRWWGSKNVISLELFSVICIFGYRSICHILYFQTGFVWVLPKLSILTCLPSKAALTHAASHYWYRPFCDPTHHTP